MRYKVSPAGGGNTRSCFSYFIEEESSLYVDAQYASFPDWIFDIVVLKMSEDLRPELEKFLETLNVQTSCVEHPPVKRFRFPANSPAHSPNFTVLKQF